MDQDILGLIPARSGSKGLPGKNVKPFLGKPLIAWTIERALESDYLDRVVVSTDSKEYADIATDYGAEAPYIRPDDLAQDESPTIDVIEHAVEWLEREEDQQFDSVVLLQTTSPLRRDDEIDDAIESFYENDWADSLVTVGEAEHEHPYLAKQVSDGRLEPFLNDLESFHQRQQLPEVYYPYGVLFISYVAELLDAQTFYQENTLAFEIDQWQCYEIDDRCDFLCAERILEDRLE